MRKKQTKKTVLVVDDSAPIRKELVHLVEKHGYKTIEAKNGEEGLKKALKQHPDMILLDVMMPVMDGMAMLKELRKDEWGHNVFVLILTNAEPSNELIDEASRYPYASSYLMKSEHDFSEIIDAINQRLKKKVIN